MDKVIKSTDKEKDTIVFDDSFKGKMANKADAAWRELEKVKEDPEALEKFKEKISKNIELADKNLEKHDTDGTFAEIFEETPDDSYLDVLKTACGVEEDDAIGEDVLTDEEEAELAAWSEEDAINTDFITPEQLHRSFDLDEDLSDAEMSVMKRLETEAKEAGEYEPVRYNELLRRNEGGFKQGAKEKWKKIVASEMAKLDI